jgi:hypothetical protein
MWYDTSEKKIYAPMHCEVESYNGLVMRKIHLASSTDKGLTWKYEGLLLSRDDPGSLRQPPEFSGLTWNGGDGDFILYVDKRGGYIYLFTNHYTQPKAGSPGAGFCRHCVARCAITDKMAPGKWKMFYNGDWNQPGIGGKASYVNAYCVTYNSYLKKYLSFNYLGGISYCDDLSKQEWSSSFHLGNYWGINGVWGYWATNEEKNEIFNSGQNFFVYSFWRKIPGRRFRIALDQGSMQAKLGFATPASWLNAPDDNHPVFMDPGQLYGFTPLFESSDPIESRQTRRVGSSSSEAKYTGTWLDVDDLSYNGGNIKASSEKGASVEFTFKGRDIYWRAVKGPDAGKADVFLDGDLQTTVDCWASLPSAFQFAFIKLGLNGDETHTIKVVVKNEKNTLSSGTMISHLLFEYSAETYRASDGFSSIQGKNQWYYQEKKGSVYTNLTFKDPYWIGTGKNKNAVSYSTMIPDTNGAIRKWVAPHAGKIRIEGAVTVKLPTVKWDPVVTYIEKEKTSNFPASNGKDVKVSIYKNESNLVSGNLSNNASPWSYDIYVHVKTGDSIYFIVD